MCWYPRVICESVLNTKLKITGIQKKYMYDESYLDELLKKYEGTFFRNKEDLLRLISGGYINENEINKRPLSKHIKDISEQLELF